MVCYVSSVLKPNITTKRLEEIEGIQDRLRTLAKEYKDDFTEPNALDAVIDKDLQLLSVRWNCSKGFTNPRPTRSTKYTFIFQRRAFVPCVLGGDVVDLGS